MRDRRNGTQTITKTDAPIEAAPEATPQEPTDAASQAEKAKRAPRPAINVGEITVTKSTRKLEDVSLRPSKITSDPVYLAVKAAAFDEMTDIHTTPDHVDAVKKRLRGVSDAKHLNVGMTIVPGHPQSDQDESKVVVTFIKRQERATRTPKSDSAKGGPVAPTEAEAAEHNASVNL